MRGSDVRYTRVGVVNLRVTSVYVDSRSIPPVYRWNKTDTRLWCFRTSRCVRVRFTSVSVDRKRKYQCIGGSTAVLFLHWLTTLRFTSVYVDFTSVYVDGTKMLTVKG